MFVLWEINKVIIKFCVQYIPCLYKARWSNYNTALYLATWHYRSTCFFIFHMSPILSRFFVQQASLRVGDSIIALIWLHNMAAHVLLDCHEFLLQKFILKNFLVWDLGKWNWVVYFGTFNLFIIQQAATSCWACLLPSSCVNLPKLLICNWETQQRYTRINRNYIYIIFNVQIFFLGRGQL